MWSDDQCWCDNQCIVCERVVSENDSYCSPACQAADAGPHDHPHAIDDSTWKLKRVAVWLQSIDSGIPPPAAPRIHLSPSQRLLRVTPQYPTASLTYEWLPSEPPKRQSPPRVARTPTAADALVASSTPSSMSIGDRVRSLPRLTLFSPKARPPLPPSDVSTSDGDASPVWWITPEPQTSAATSPSSRILAQRRVPPSRGCKSPR